MSNLNIALFADNKVGANIVQFFLEEYPEDLKYVMVTNEASEIVPLVEESNLDNNILHYSDDLYKESNISKLLKLNLDYIILAWWPNIIKKEIFPCGRKGILNFHPSLLPYNRGKHYNFWNIIEDVPFGVTIHFIDELIDGGDIVFQEKIEKSWKDTGESLHFKAELAICNLFKNSYKLLIINNFSRKKQKVEEGSFHLSDEIDQASHIVLDKKYTARELLNILRARTYSPHPGAWFMDDGHKYEIRISINEID